MQYFEYEKAICYSGYRLGQSPKGTVPTKEQIEEDIELLYKDGYRYLRMYDPNMHARRVLEVIHEKHLPIKCMIGIDSDPEVNNLNCPFDKQNYSAAALAAHIARNDAELDKLIELVKEYPDEVMAVSIGNENTPDWGAHMVSEDRLIEHADKLKRELDKPVTFCEGVFEWKKLKRLAEHLDFISVHSYPLHYGETIDNAIPMNREHLKMIREMFPDKQVIFTEIGWTSQPNDNMKPGEATPENQKRYITELAKWLDDEKIIAFIFEAFDEPWKGSKPESSECNWGLYYENRQKKWN